MTRIGVLGANGCTGALVVRELARRGHAFVAAGRSHAAVRSTLDAVPSADARIEVVDVTAPAELRDLIAGLDVVLTTVGPFGPLGRDVLVAAVEGATHYVDCSGEQGFSRWAHAHWHAAARDAGITAVSAGGFGLVGDLLVAVAASRCDRPSEAHVAYVVPERRLRKVASTGTRRTAVAELGRTGVALVAGSLVDELPGEARRLAWFPRPVGPRHAAGWPGGEPVTVPRHVPAITTVRTYVALSSWRAELLQLAASAAKIRRVRSLLARGVGAGQPSETTRRATRWGCVAEIAGDPGGDAGPVRSVPVRAWAFGHDPYRLTATAMVAVAESILAGEAACGVVPPALAGRPSDLLDELAARTDLRWSIAS